MYTIMIITLPIMLIIFLLITLNYLIEWKSFMDREKPTPFECGFNPITSARLPFSIQFYLISVIFLIFDIEIILLIPLLPTLLMNQYLTDWLISILSIYIMLLSGLLYEWNEQSIIWLK